MKSKEIIARRVALEFKDGDVINLGFGIPNASADYIPEGVNVILQAEMVLFVLVRHQQKKIMMQIWQILEEHPLLFYREHRCLTYKLRLPLFVEVTLMLRF